MLVQHRHNDAGNSFGSLSGFHSLSLCLSLGSWSRARCARSAAKNPNKNNPKPSSALPSPRIRVTCKFGARCSLCSARLGSVRLGSAYVLILHVQRGVCVLLWRSNRAATLGADAALPDCLEYMCSWLLLRFAGIFHARFSRLIVISIACSSTACPSSSWPFGLQHSQAAARPWADCAEGQRQRVAVCVCVCVGLSVCVCGCVCYLSAQ